MLSEFQFSNRAKDKHIATCKTCIGKRNKNDEAPIGGCCEDHFSEMTAINTFEQLDNLLEIVEALQYNEVEVPKELLEKISRIIRNGSN